MRWVAVVTTLVLLVGITLYLVGALVYSIRKEKRRSGLRKTWGYFGLSISLMALFLASWLGQGVSQWRLYVEEQQAHREPVEAVGFIEHFGQSTFENWQSEFLQLFSFVVLSAVLIHRGSAESKDSDDKMQAALERIEKKLGTREG